MFDYTSLLFQFFLNLISIFIFAYLIYYRRYQDRESLTLFAIFNLLLFPFLNIDFQMSSQFGFALFAILAVIRIRSNAFSKREMAYFFGSIALGVINGIGMQSELILVLSNAVILLVAYIVDHPKILPEQETEKTRLLISNLEPALLANRPALIQELSQHLNLPVVDVVVKSIDLIRQRAEIDVVYPKLLTVEEQAAQSTPASQTKKKDFKVEQIDPTAVPSS
ncbi:MAG: DUF4956 domain-containing protein [Chloroflexota bacterium]